jgi:hypothetical protein
VAINLRLQNLVRFTPILSKLSRKFEAILNS